MTESGPLHEITSVGQVPMDRLRTIFDGMFDGVWLLGTGGRTTYTNEAMAGMLGTTPRVMLGRPMSDFLSEESRPVADELIRTQRERGSKRSDLRFMCADGGDLWTLVAASPIETAEGTYVGSMLNVSDVTGKRAAQTQALQSQKLEAIGEFAAGISHDFNNLLTSIRGFVELANAGVTEGSQIQSDLKSALESTDRASSITAKLLAFTRHQVLTSVPVDAAEVIAGMLPMLRPLLTDEVQIEVEIGARGSVILIDPVALEQILVNIAINARDAMPLGGTLTISLDEVAGHGREALGADGPRPASIRLRVSDTGIGMDESTKARVFDPFFTTKELGKGTGLGLSTVYGLVTQMGGDVHLESVPGVGSTFTIYLPVLSPLLAIDPPEPETASVSAIGVVLVVDDDDAVREVTRRILVGGGHAIFDADNGGEALDIAAMSAPIDVLLTDVVMPGMRGPMLAAKLREGQPDLRVIYTSGYSADAVDDLVGTGPLATFLPKPFTAASLLAAVGAEIAIARLRDPHED
ncbi:MAG: ATP-binding protein [Candidatus Limnocylindrales bacterium]